MSTFIARAVLTGASGFVGTALRARLGDGAVAIRLGGADWNAPIRAAALRDATVFHLAARAHASDGRDETPFMRDHSKNIDTSRVL